VRVALLAAITDQFDVRAFPAEQRDSSGPCAHYFTNASDPRIAISVVTAGMPEGRYSVRVEVPRDEDNGLLPFDFAAEAEDADLQEVLAMFKRFARP